MPYSFAEMGKSFGEVALLSENAERNASVVADTDMELLVVHRELYNRTIRVGNFLNHYNGSSVPPSSAIFVENELNSEYFTSEEQLPSILIVSLRN